MNRPTKNKTKAIVYSCCWQSVSVASVSAAIEHNESVLV